MRLRLRFAQANLWKGRERPSKDAEPTTEHLSAIQHLLDAGLPPYVDFAIFGPYGRHGAEAAPFRCDYHAGRCSSFSDFARPPEHRIVAGLICSSADRPSDDQGRGLGHPDEVTLPHRAAT